MLFDGRQLGVQRRERPFECSQGWRNLVQFARACRAAPAEMPHRRRRARRSLQRSPSVRGPSARASAASPVASALCISSSARGYSSRKSAAISLSSSRSPPTRASAVSAIQNLFLQLFAHGKKLSSESIGSLAERYDILRERGPKKSEIARPCPPRATLAQLVERLIRNQQVAGSIPAGGSTKPLHGQ